MLLYLSCAEQGPQGRRHLQPVLCRGRGGIFNWGQEALTNKGRRYKRIPETGVVCSQSREFEWNVDAMQSKSAGNYSKGTAAKDTSEILIITNTTFWKFQIKDLHLWKIENYNL